MKAKCSIRKDGINLIGGFEYFDMRTEGTGTIASKHNFCNILGVQPVRKHRLTFRSVLS
jgi:hypothetical protein